MELAGLEEKPLLARTASRRSHRSLLRSKRHAGAGLLLGTDGVDGSAIHRTMQLYVESGLTPYQALATATRNVAVFLGTLDDRGQ